MKKTDCKKAGKNLIDGHGQSTDDDYLAIGTACFWIGYAASAQFQALESAKYYLAGRGREVSFLEAKHLSIQVVNEDRRNFRVINAEVNDKQQNVQRIPLFPHRDHIQQDVYFALIYNILVSTYVETYLFDAFAVRARRHLKGETKATVSQLWTSRFKSIFKHFAEIADQVDVNPNLRSHSGKGGSNQKLAENPITAGLPQVFHSGWELRAVHTLFDYVLPSASVTKRTARVLANWSDGTAGEPPNIFDIRGAENLRMARAVCLPCRSNLHSNRCRDQTAGFLPSIAYKSCVGTWFCRGAEHCVGVAHDQ